MYHIEFRHDLNLLDIKWSKLFTAQEVAAYARECKARFLAEGFKPGYLLRMDMSASSQARPAVASSKIRR